MDKNSPLARIREEVLTLSPYHVPSSEGMVKLDAMENPFSWPQELTEPWLKIVSRLALNRYPEPRANRLKEKLLNRLGPKQGSAVLFGNGSDEIIQLLAMAVAKPGASILTVSPSFSMYKMIAQIIDLPCHEIPLDSHFELDIEAMLKAIDQYDPALIFLAYPNNPTGNLWSREQIEQIIQASSGLVVLDEAYGPFASDSFVKDLAQYPHLLVLRTVSKLGFAGVRFGWLTASHELITELDKLRLPYNINQLTEATVEFAIDHYDVFADQAKQLCKNRTTLFEQLTNIDALEAYPSEANFILFRVEAAAQVFERLIQNKVLIKNLSSQAGLENCLRVTVGSEEENAQFMQALAAALH